MSPALSRHVSAANEDGRAGDLPQRPLQFTPPSAAVEGLPFDSPDAASGVAWYRQGSAAPVRGLRVSRDRLFEAVQAATGPCSAILSADGVLVRNAQGVVEAVQAERFAARYTRCLADGSALCPLSASPIEQAQALAASSKSNDERLEALLATRGLKALVRFRRLAAEKDELKRWTHDIQAHIADLARHRRLAQ